MADTPTCPREAMQVVTEDARDGADLREVIWVMARGAGGMSVLYGLLVILVPGIEHSPHLRIVWMLPGSPTSWGVLIIAAGAATLVGTMLRIRAVADRATSLCAVWTGMVGLAGTWSGVTGNTSALPAAVLYLGTSCGLFIIAYSVRHMRCIR